LSSSSTSSFCRRLSFLTSHLDAALQPTMAEIEIRPPDSAHLLHLSAPTAVDSVLKYTLYWLAFTLLIVFIGFAGALSIICARTDEDFVKPSARGPGGKPLPVTKRKRKGGQGDGKKFGPDFGPCARRSFQGLSVCLIFTFVANAIAIAVHTIQSVPWPFKGGDEGWWAPHCVSVCYPETP
jgi:hypothetical protein